MLRAKALLAADARVTSGERAILATFSGFVERHNPTLLRFEHAPRLVDIADRIALGELRRVIVCMPPRYLKTEIFGRLLPAHFLRRHAAASVGVMSYSADLAWTTSDEARTRYLDDGGTLLRSAAAKKHWETEQGGQLWAAGVGGSRLGFGYDLGVVDDPMDPEQAHSPAYLRRFADWWPAKFISRQEPGAAIVLVMQRIGVDDPVDFLFRREIGEDTDEAPEHWHVVICDEIRSDEPLGRWSGPRGLPPTCTLEPDPRPIGAVLAPSRFSPEQVTAAQRAAGPYVNAAQRQQRPSVPRGDFWKEEWFHVYDDLPADAFNGGRDWDTAYTKDEANSASAQLRSFRGPAPDPGNPNLFPVYIDDVDWDWLEYPELVYWMGGQKPTNGRSGEITPLAGPHYIEEKATGKSAAQSLRREGVIVAEVAVQGDKFARAAAVQPIVSAGRVHVRRSVLRKLLYGERQGLLRVTAERLLAGGPDLDVNDVFVQAVNRQTRAERKLTPFRHRTW
jgi:hypothetical protein